jgi:hypothetical protein
VLRTPTHGAEEEKQVVITCCVCMQKYSVTTTNSIAAGFHFGCWVQKQCGRLGTRRFQLPEDQSRVVRSCLKYTRPLHLYRPRQVHCTCLSHEAMTTPSRPDCHATTPCSHTIDHHPVVWYRWPYGKWYRTPWMQVLMQCHAGML